MTRRCLSTSHAERPRDASGYLVAKIPVVAIVRAVEFAVTLCGVEVQPTVDADEVDAKQRAGQDEVVGWTLRTLLIVEAMVRARKARVTVTIGFKRCTLAPAIAIMDVSRQTYLLKWWVSRAIDLAISLVIPKGLAVKERVTRFVTKVGCIHAGIRQRSIVCSVLCTGRDFLSGACVGVTISIVIVERLAGEAHITHRV